jgi:hypothetical protein
LFTSSTPFGDVEGLKNDCMSFLFEVLHKFDPSRGSKAFSYFDIVAKHWFIQKTKVSKKKSKTDVYLDKTISDRIEKEEADKKQNLFEEKIIDYQFHEALKTEIKRWRTKFAKKQEKLVLESIILVFDNPDLITLHNKKAVFLYLREISGLTTKQLVSNIGKFQKRYMAFKKRYYAGEL